MCFSRNRRHTIQDLKPFLQKNPTALEANLYKYCKVLIIDDDVNRKDYPFINGIRLLRENYSCQISSKRDLESLNDAAGYDIIICDHLGVGQKIFGSKGTGTMLIKQLQSKYPEKCYVLLSSGSFSLRGLRNLNIDKWDKQEFIQSTESNEEAFVDKIKRKIYDCADPVSRWNRIRVGLLEQDMSIFTVAELESSYVSSILNKNEDLFKKRMASVQSVTETVNGYLQTAVSVINIFLSLLAL